MCSSDLVTSDYIPVKTLTNDDGSLQWQTQNNAVDGAIHSIVISEFGSGYTSNSIYVTIDGDGQDANAYAVINTISNTVSSVIVDHLGFNYTFANITFQSSTGGNTAVGRAVISPPGGHGSDPLVELGGSNIMINSILKADEGTTLPVSHKYRQIALIENPAEYGTSNTATESVYLQTMGVNLSGSSVEYDLYETVYQGVTVYDASFSGVVVDWDSANNKLLLSNVRGTPSAQLVIGETSGAARFLSSTTDPGLESRTGHLLYIENIVPITRAFDQAEDFKIILNF